MGCDHLSLHLNQKSTPLVIICCMTQPPACHAYWRAFVSWLFCIKGASISRYFGLVSSEPKPPCVLIMLVPWLRGVVEEGDRGSALKGQGWVGH